MAAILLGLACELAYLGGAVFDFVPRPLGDYLFFSFGPLLSMTAYALG